MNTVARHARLQSLADGIPRLGPRTVHLDLINTCNARCVTCWDHSPLLPTPRTAAWKRERLSAHVVTALLDEIQSLGGLEAVILSGMGEPFLHPQIDTIIAAVKERGLNLTIITNLVAAEAGTILDLAVDQLLVGIHAATLETYSAFHPGFGRTEWQHLHAALTRFGEAGRAFKHVHVICAANAHELSAMIAQGARYRAAQVNFKLASLGPGTEAVRITDEQRHQLLAESLPAAEAEAARLGVRHNLHVLRAQLNAGGATTAAIEDVGCWLGYEYARVTAVGTVLYCCSTEVEVGRLNAPGDFSRLWRGPVWQGLRERLARKQFFSACQQCGKLNQNLKLAERYASQVGGRRWPDRSPLQNKEVA
jgi:wyosine [tRNA(Phe)-imidazoG37] synthetase (radical SAM superfamily)